MNSSNFVQSFYSNVYCCISKIFLLVVLFLFMYVFIKRGDFKNGGPFVCVLFVLFVLLIAVLSGIQKQIQGRGSLNLKLL